MAGESYRNLLPIQQLSFARDLDTITQIVSSTARRLTNADGVTFVVRDAEHCHYVDEDAISPLWKGQRFPLSTCISGWTMLNGTRAVIPDVYADVRVPHDVYRQTFVKSLLMEPVGERDPMAAIGVYWATEHEASEDETDVLHMLANAAARAVANVELYAGLQKALEQERKAREVAERGDRTKAELLANIAHELRSPLGVIRNWCFQLRRPELTSDLISHAAWVIEQNVGMQARLVEDLLNASRQTTGHLTLKKRLLDALDACRIVVEMARPEADRRSVSLELAGEGAVMVCADPHRFQQIIWNLINNALKFTPAEGRVEVSVRRSDSGVCLQVRDSGLGIPPDALPLIFERFHHADSSVPGYDGLGLGLTIVRQIVAAHGGRVWAASAGVGQGSLFTVELPDSSACEEPDD